MSTTTILDRPTSPTTARRRLEGPLLVATDGTPQSLGAFAAAVCIAAGGTRRADRTPKLQVRVVTVCDALPLLPPDVAAVVPLDFVKIQRAEKFASAIAQVRYNVADLSNWNVNVISGPPAPTIARAADESRASLVILGLGRHDLLDRVFGSETALRVIRSSHVPVLAVPQNWIGIPRRVLIAVDFGPASIRAARTAMRIMPPGANVCFAHVAPAIGLPDYDVTLADIYQQSLSDEFDRFIDAVGVPEDITVERKALYGETAHALLEFAKADGVDMIVSGTHGVNAIARLMVGSVATRLIRGAHCAVLVASAESRQEIPDCVFSNSAKQSGRALQSASPTNVRLIDSSTNPNQ